MRLTRLPVFVAAILSLISQVAGARPVRFNTSPPFRECSVQVADRVRSAVQTATCGAIVHLPAGNYLVWATQHHAISPVPTELAVEPGTSELQVSLLDPTARAGEVAIQAIRSEVVELVHLQPPRADDGTRRPLFRVRATNGTALLVPQGPMICIARDRGGAPRWVTEPITVSADKRRVIQARHTNAADLLVELSVPSGVTADGDPPPTAGKRIPDVWVAAADAIVAVWYDLPLVDPVVVAASGATWFSRSQQATLRRSQINWIRGEIQRLPTLQVVVNTDRPEEITEPLAIKVNATAHEKVIELAARAGLTEVPNVPADNVEISLLMGTWRFVQELDMTDGANRTVTFELKPSIVTGTVMYGDKSVRAKVAFNGDKRHDVLTDDTGKFRIPLWSLRRYGLAIKLTDYPDVPVFTDTVRISGDRDLKICIPATAVRTRVINARTGDPVPNALLMVKNMWTDDAEGPRTNLVRIKANEQGEAVLPPLREGAIEVVGEAPGFAPGKPATYAIRSADHTETIVIRLEEGGTVHLRVTLFDGRPAVGGMAVGLIDDRVAWTATADAQGMIVVPDDFDGRIAVRHEDAAGKIGEWRRGTSAAEWQLELAAPPVKVTVINHGGDPAPDARIILWTGDTRIEGVALTFLYQAPPFSLPDGTWPARNLPAHAIRILALQSYGGGDRIEAHDSLATSLLYPWPLRPTVQTVN